MFSLSFVSVVVLSSSSSLAVYRRLSAWLCCSLWSLLLIRWSALILLRSICLLYIICMCIVYCGEACNMWFDWFKQRTAAWQLRHFWIPFLPYDRCCFIVVVVFFVGVLTLSYAHISLNIRTNSQKLWVHFFFLLFAYSQLPFTTAMKWWTRFYQKSLRQFFRKLKKKLHLEIKESICCFRTNILLYVCCILYFEWNCEITPKNFWSQPIWQIADSLFNFDISIN